MKESYINMRAFWLDASNLIPKNTQMPLLGEKQICVAGVEFAMEDHNGVLKHIFIAGSSLGEASIYFENNSASGIGGFMGGQGTQEIKEAAVAMVHLAADLAPKMMEVKELPEVKKGHFLFFAVSKTALYAHPVDENAVQKMDHAYFKFFAETQNILVGFRKREANKAVEEKEIKESNA